MLHELIFLPETGTRRHVIMLHYGNGDKPNSNAASGLVLCMSLYFEQ